uniref:Uncharacterized protein n=1 Tax=Anguilla anguilla TaxID=7936 RepID=A0A0E9PNT6_ANGAN
MLFLEAKTRVESFQRTISVQLVKRLKRYRHVNLFGLIVPPIGKQAPKPACLS